MRTLSIMKARHFGIVVCQLCLMEDLSSCMSGCLERWRLTSTLVSPVNCAFFEIYSIWPMTCLEPTIVEKRLPTGRVPSLPIKSKILS